MNFSSPPQVPPRLSLSELSDRFDTLFCDIWGVVHDGVRPYESAVDALCRFRSRGGRVALVSNSPTPSQPLAEQLFDIGVPQAAFDVVASSGQTTRHWLERRKGCKVYFLGEGGYGSILQDLELELVELAKAELVLITSLVARIGYLPEHYQNILKQMRAKTLPLICANPDHMVEVGGVLQYEPGAIASLYEAMGGEVVYTGKPHAPIYDYARSQLFESYGHHTVPERTLAIGDSLRTDMAGAKAQGVAGLLIEAGVNRSEVEAGSLAKMLFDAGLSPVSVLPQLYW